jgi:hypothetical protein
LAFYETKPNGTTALRIEVAGELLRAGMRLGLGSSKR